MLAVALIVISIAIHFLHHWNNVGRQKEIAKKEIGFAMFVIVAGVISIAICALIMCFDRLSSTSDRVLVNPVKR